MEPRLSDPKHAGRPRDQKLDEAILGAATELFLERGYHATAISEVAKRAGVGTPAIYRRWPDKAALAIEVLSEAAGEDEMPSTDSIRHDLIGLVRSRIRNWRTPIFHQVLVPLMNEGLSNANLHRRIAERYVLDMQPQLARIRRAVDEGELNHVEPQVMLDLLGGPIAVPLLFNQPLPEEADAESIVDAALAGIAAHKAPERS